ncbi:MAG: hypothetical protein FD189_2218 [Elusimicrobia bacterium]|nr:MAG: hypothetical protein FD154_2231 [Elusimicrobiota bacterium]KAF0153868.1 MAG: hypothetical protein FD189_2218 [Elusimicrobiota bacterium]
MKPSPVLKTALLVFVAAAAGAMVYKAAVTPHSGKEAQGSTSAVEAPAPAAPAAAATAVKTPAPVRREAETRRATVYYFFTNTRCRSCNTLEKYTREAVEGNFRDPYKGWMVEFRGVNLDDPANSHFVDEYKLTSKAVVAQKFEGDRPLAWKELPEVWRLLGSKELFAGYVVGEIQGLLDAQ